jgi:hypothetical protein
VPGGERPQERSQRRGCVAACEDPAHAAVPQQGHVVDGVRAGDHPRDQRGDLIPAFAPLSVGTDSCCWASSWRPADRASARSGTSPADDTRLGSSNTAEVARSVWLGCIYEMPFVLVELGP